ncbi:MAG TPA: diaminopimelate epimerase [Victivallales bacterium]|nr:diaminopimelate epimerase [Victivallales bacterium]
MEISFTKLHGAGNDFILIDYKSLENSLPTDFITEICSRNRGIGANGILHILESDEPMSYDIIMIYYNSDGSRGEMCGNGLRCASCYAHKHLGLNRKIKIKTDVGILDTDNLDDNMVKIQIPVIKVFKEIKINNNTVYYGNTGVPHSVIFMQDIENIDIDKMGKFYRNHDTFMPDGTNVNFLKIEDNFSPESTFCIRTYERGVEGETSACGTGISAAALCLNRFKNIPPPIKLKTIEGDILKVDFTDDDCNNVHLIGPVKEICNGKYLKR